VLDEAGAVDAREDDAERPLPDEQPTAITIPSRTGQMRRTAAE
jgi:hypothetical protein